jgi:hypothetical protein
VLEQPVPVGLVVGLGGGRLRPALPQVALLGEEAVEQRAQVAVLDRADELAQVGDHPVERDRRRVVQVGRVVAALGRLAHRAHGQARAVALLDLVAALDDHDGAGRGHRHRRFDALPHHALDHPGDVAELELQERVAVALLAPRALAHEERRLDLLPVDEIPNKGLCRGNAIEGGLCEQVHRE